MNKLEKSIEIAKKYHGKQKYGSKSYFDGHLKPALEIAKKYTSNEDLLIAVVLHDVLEDTEYTLDELKRDFGAKVANLVYKVTDEGGGNRAEKKERTYQKLRGDSDAIFIKLVDRIANTKSGAKNDMYRKEHARFKESLYKKDSRNDKLWREIEKNLGLTWRP